MHWKKLTHVALAAATLSGIAATASAQGQSCPDDALARTNSLERQIEQRLLAAQQNPPTTQFIPNQDDMFNQVHALFNACPDNTAVNQKLPFMFYSLSQLAESTTHRAAISDIAYIAMMRAKDDLRETIDDEQTSAGRRNLLHEQRNTLMTNLSEFTIPAMATHGVLTGSGFAAFSMQETPNVCPYAPSERFLLLEELEAHRQTTQNAVVGLAQSGYVITEPPLEYRLKALRRACRDHARQITVDLALQWTFIAAAAMETPDGLQINGEPQPSNLVETASATARDFLENSELMREDPFYLDETVSLPERFAREVPMIERTRLANLVRRQLDEIASARRNAQP